MLRGNDTVEIARCKRIRCAHASGAGKIAGVDNGNAATVEPFHADHRKAFNGLALLIVRSKVLEAGSIQVSATGAGLAPAQITLEAR